MSLSSSQASSVGDGHADKKEDTVACESGSTIERTITATERLLDDQPEVVVGGDMKTRSEIDEQPGTSNDNNDWGGCNSSSSSKSMLREYGDYDDYFVDEELWEEHMR